MLSNLITAKSLEANPDTQANNKTVNVIKLFQPAGLENNDFIFLPAPQKLSNYHSQTQQFKTEPD